MDIPTASPTEPENTDGCENPRHHGERKTALGESPQPTGVLHLKLHVELIHDARSNGRDEHTNTHTSKGSSRLAVREPIVALEDERERGEVQVQDTVDDTGVDGNESDGKLGEEQAKRGDQGVAESGTGGKRSLLPLCLVAVVVAGLFADGSGLLAEDRAVEGLGEEESEEGDDHSEDDVDAESPSPVGILNDEATGNRTYVGSDKTGIERQRGKHTDRRSKEGTQNAKSDRNTNFMSCLRISVNVLNR